MEPKVTICPKDDRLENWPLAPDHEGWSISKCLRSVPPLDKQTWKEKYMFGTKKPGA